MLLATEKYAEKAKLVFKGGIQTESAFDIKPKIITGAIEHDTVRLEEQKASAGGMMLYTSGTTNRPVAGVLQIILNRVLLTRGRKVF